MKKIPIKKIKKKKKDRTSVKFSATYCCSCNSSPFKTLRFGHL